MDLNTDENEAVAASGQPGETRREQHDGVGVDSCPSSPDNDSGPTPTPLGEEMRRRGLSPEMVTLLAPHETTVSESHQLSLASRFRKRDSYTLPYRDVAGRLTSMFRVRYYDGDPKYGSPVGVPPSVYFSVGVDWGAIKGDPTAPIVFTEGEISSLVACTYGLNCLGLPGVWAFGSKKAGFSFPLELADWGWKGREVTIVYDSDASQKAGVRAAMFVLAGELRKRGARVTFKTLPQEPDGSKNGLDDYLLRHGRKAFDAIPDERFARDEIIAELSTRFTKVEHPVCVWDSEAFNGSDCAKGAPLSIQDFYNLTDDSRFSEPDRAGKEVSKHGGMEWHQTRETPRVTGIDFDPSFQLEANFLNLARGFATEPKRNDAIIKRYWTPALNHVANGDGETMRNLERWAAYPAKHPGAKLHYGVAISGPQWAGKSLIGQLVGSVYHPEHYNEIDGDALFANFNDELARKQFIVANEISHSDKRRDAGKLKNCITRDRIRINGKYQRDYTIRDTINWVLTSNDGDFLWLDDDDRRWHVIAVEKVIDHALAVAAFEQFKGKSDEGRAALLWHFQNGVDLTDFDPKGRAPDSPAKRDLIEAGRSDRDKFIHNVADMIIEDSAKRKGPHPFDLRTVEDLAAQFKEEFGKDESGSATAGSLRRDRRWVRVSRPENRPRVGGRLYTVFAAAHTAYWKKQTTKALTKALIEGSLKSNSPAQADEELREFMDWRAGKRLEWSNLLT